MSAAPLRLHIGSGAQRLPGFLNVDRRAFPGVDVVADVTRGFDYRDGAVEAVYAEHFLEHLALSEALAFLAEVRRVLAADGWLRLSTPNLDWVWKTHYRLHATDTEKRSFALMMNRAFHGWEHKFLWNREMLGKALELSGYRDLAWQRYGESSLPFFQGVERHETWEDEEEMPHVLIVEAAKGPARPDELARFTDWLRHEYLRHVEEGF